MQNNFGATVRLIQNGFEVRQSNVVQWGGYNNRTLSKKSTMEPKIIKKKGNFVGPFLDIESLYVALHLYAAFFGYGLAFF